MENLHPMRIIAFNRTELGDFALIILSQSIYHKVECADIAGFRDAIYASTPKLDVNIDIDTYLLLLNSGQIINHSNLSKVSINAM